MRSSWAVWCATLGPMGNFKAPGTVASLLTLMVIGICSALQMPLHESFFILVITTIFALVVVNKAIQAFPGDHDPRSIVLDEVIGTLATFYLLPLQRFTVIGGFILFRVLDVFKPFGIAKIERFHNSWGIVLDDLIAGLLANIIVKLVMKWI